MSKPLTVFGIKNCSTMKKAFDWLDSAAVTYDFHDYKKLGVPPGALRDWAEKVGWRSLLNTQGTTWRKLSDAQRADVDETKALALMEEFPSLIKRPVIAHGDEVLLGFDAERYANALKQGSKG